MPEKLRAGIVGLGLVASSHAKGYHSHPDARLAAVCDLDKERAREFGEAEAKKAGGELKVYTDFDDMLADPELEIIDIATPTFLHAEMARKAAEAGKHVHCEKPFCRFLKEGQAAVNAAAKNDVTLVVGETYVFISSHMKARELIDAGEIGRPLQIRQRHGAWIEREQARVYTGPAERNWRVDPEQSGGGDFPWIFDHAVHFFATAEYLCGDSRIAEVHAVRSEAKDVKRQSGAKHDPYLSAEKDIPIITWRHEDSDRQGVWMRAERLNGKFDFMQGFSTSVIGETGMIEVLGEGGNNLLWNGKQVHLILHREGREPLTFRFDEGGDDIWESEISYYSRGHVNQVHHLIDSVISGAAPRYGGADGVRAIRNTLAAVRSAREGRKVSVDEIGPDYTAY